MRARWLFWMWLGATVACGAPPPGPAEVAPVVEAPAATEPAAEQPGAIAEVPTSPAEAEGTESPGRVVAMPPPTRPVPPEPVVAPPPPPRPVSPPPDPAQPPPVRPPPVRPPDASVRPDVYACETAADCMIYCPDISGCCGEPCGCRSAIRKDGRAAFDTWTAATCARQPHCPAVGCAYEPATSAACRDGRCVSVRGLGL